MQFQLVRGKNRDTHGGHKYQPDKEKCSYAFRSLHTAKLADRPCYIRGMMNIGAFLSFALLGTGALHVHAQSFTQTFGPLYAQDGVGAQVIPSGYIIVAREFIPAFAMYGARQHTANASGVLQNSASVDLPGSTFLQDVVNAADGSAILVGSVLTEDGVDHDGIIVKVQTNGNVVWATIPDEPGAQQYFGGAMLSDGGVVICGVSDPGDGHDVLVVRFDPLGAVVWSHTEPSATDGEAYAIVVSGNDIIVTGRQMTSGGHADVLLMRMDLDGGVIWSTTSGGDADEEGRALVRIGSDTFVSAGWTDSYGAFDTTSQRIPDHAYLIAFDLDGDTLWTETVGDTLLDRRCFAMERAPNGDLLLSGERGSTGLSDAMLIRTNSSGVPIWERSIDTGKEERITHLIPLADGFVGTGWSFGPFGKQVLFIRRNGDGF